MRAPLVLLAAVVLMAASCSKAQKPEVTVYMFSEYTYPELPAEFEKATGIRLRIVPYEATEEMMAKLQQGGGASQYDVVVMSDHAITMLSGLGLLQPLDLSKVPNARNVMDQFKHPSFDPEGRYSLPYQWGTNGLMYRKDKLPDLPATWAVIFDPARQPGPFLMMDSMRDMLGAALQYLGYSVNSRDPQELKAAGELVLKAKKSEKCLGFEGGVGGKNSVLAGTALLAMVYNGDCVRAMDEDPNVAFMLPKEGSIIWTDAMTIPAHAPHPDYAYKFINFILDPEVGAKLSNFNRYATPNQASLPLNTPKDRANPAIYPSPAEMKGLQYVRDVGADTRLYDEVWTAVKSR
jgi:spermidine/putrescine transport system substrate-binding protein